MLLCSKIGDTVGTLDSILDLCQQHDPALTQSRHSALETYEPSGSLAFEALLAHVDRLPSIEIDKAVSYAVHRLASVPSSVRREVASSRSLRPLVPKQANTGRLWVCDRGVRGGRR